ncbi:alpha/beta fold hydrolase [Eggerthella sp. YY7918]|uniref:alpha/beta fold hydrolase n=1 Tax=Eggerthella sp. (strain YY7918) TaxID=502558 RepID=UPI0002171940|nr:alpha/beta fold hydrolase [Eggerthella sp. YY7918]BAK44645.1 hypothetical protein EGYY_15050 [Eggerthella sp. YY7918]
MLHEVSFPSYNKRDEVQGWIYVPACEPMGIVQLVHGFGEHSRRYLHMIVALMDAGFIVAADDHVGHGKTAIANDTWGDWGDAGCHTMMEDEHSLMELTREKYPDLPYFMFGHSMGSMIARDFAATYGDELTGLIICGTPGIFRMTDEVAPKLQAAIDEGKAHESDPAFVGELMGWMFARCEEGAQLGNEWICHDPYVQKDHAEDPFDAFTHPTHNISLLNFIEMMKVIEGPEWAAKVPADLPILNIAGDQDPVGEWGAGVYQVANWLVDTGHDVITRLYSGYRHEIHNYDDLKDEVENTIVDFLYLNV